LVHAGGYLGPRWGELAGLKRQHVDFLHSQVRIVGSLERVGSSFRYVEETKTLSGKRTIPAPPFLIERLARHLELAPASEFVFPSPTGEPLHYGNFRKRVWKPAVDAAGVGPFTPHGLRHSAAALWIAQGANPVTIQRRMGHKDVRTSLQVYGHLLPEQDDMLTARMEDLRAEALAAYSRPGGAQTLKAVR